MYKESGQKWNEVKSGNRMEQSIRVSGKMYLTKIWYITPRANLSKCSYVYKELRWTCEDQKLLERPRLP